MENEAPLLYFAPLYAELTSFRIQGFSRPTFWGSNTFVRICIVYFHFHQNRRKLFLNHMRKLCRKFHQDQSILKTQKLGELNARDKHEIRFLTENSRFQTDTKSVRIWIRHSVNVLIKHSPFLLIFGYNSANI